MCTLSMHISIYIHGRNVVIVGNHITIGTRIMIYYNIILGAHDGCCAAEWSTEKSII